jgi:hypothetical protein
LWPLCLALLAPLRTLRLLTSLRALLLLALMLRVGRRWALPARPLLGDRCRGGDREQQREQRSG